MSDPQVSGCRDLFAFCEGELSRRDADAFRRHLPDCTACQSALHDHMQFAAQLSDLGTDVADCISCARVGRQQTGMVDRYVIALAMLADLVAEHIAARDAVDDAMFSDIECGAATRRLNACDEQLRAAVGSPLVRPFGDGEAVQPQWEDTRRDAPQTMVLRRPEWLTRIWRWLTW